MDVPLPDDDEIRECVKVFVGEVFLEIDDKAMEELIFSLKGLKLVPDTAGFVPRLSGQLHT